MPDRVDPREPAVSDETIRLHLSEMGMHCWEQDWIDAHTDAELTDQHREAHDIADRYEGAMLYRIAYPHSRIERMPRA